ncbi:MAG: carbohydrate-binding domain-containing protein [Lachnospiraceae bacterium]|nr:carbohydrate-binding domain-containing protein [Lachnospiraceae bacterium]
MKKRIGKKNIKQLVGKVLVIALALGLMGCSDKKDSKKETNVPETPIVNEMPNDFPGGNPNLPGGNPNNQGTTATINYSSLDGSAMFKDRDLESEYSRDGAVNITLKENDISTSSDVVAISDNKVIISAEGTYIVKGDLNDGQIVVEADKTAKIRIVFEGVNISNSGTSPLFIKQADKVFLTIAEGTDNSLITKGEFIETEDGIDATLFSKEDLTINGSGSLKIECESGMGIASKDDLVIVESNVQINAGSHGLDSNDSIRLKDCNLNIKSGKDGLHSENNDDTSLGYIYIASGDININAEDDGITALSNLVIDGGNINIERSNEGLEGAIVEINGGTVNLKADDDGINATSPDTDEEDFFGGREDMMGDSSLYIRISGGVTHINAGGDGIDSNGNIFVTGGETYVAGPENNGNGALDYAMEAHITGGIFVATGASGMAQNFTYAENQGAILVNIQAMTNEKTVLKDSEGNDVLVFEPDKSYNSALISCPEIVDGKSYKVDIGGNETEVTMSGLIYGNSGMGGMHGGMPGGRPGGRPDGMGPDMMR